MKRWDMLQAVLANMSFRSRKQLFLDFAEEHDRWSKRTLEILSKVVVYMLPQHQVVKMYGIHKQSINRSVKIYKEFLSERGIK